MPDKKIKIVIDVISGQKKVLDEDDNIITAEPHGSMPSSVKKTDNILEIESNPCRWIKVSNQWYRVCW